MVQVVNLVKIAARIAVNNSPITLSGPFFPADKRTAGDHWESVSLPFGLSGPIIDLLANEWQLTDPSEIEELKTGPISEIAFGFDVDNEQMDDDEYLFNVKLMSIEGSILTETDRLTLEAAGVADMIKNAVYDTFRESYEERHSNQDL